ncbi:MAG TPA: hypothetical protein VGK67_30000 [Myxococcales bacterium]|jgi:hypothetical protein
MTTHSRRPAAIAVRLASLVSLLALTGCVHVNLPEHLVSDTVDAGKDLYHSIEAAVTNEPPRPQAIFVHTCIRSQDVAVEEVERACVDELVSQTKTQLRLQTLDYAVGEHTVDKVSGSLVVNCQIALKG